MGIRVIGIFISTMNYMAWNLEFISPSHLPSPPLSPFSSFVSFFFSIFSILLCIPGWLEFVTLLPQAPECWDHIRPGSRFLVHMAHFAHSFLIYLIFRNRLLPPNIPLGSSAAHSFGSPLGLLGCFSTSLICL